MTENEIIAKINEVLADEFEANIDDITPDALLMKCLDLDSLDLVDVVVLIDNNFGVTLTGPDFVGINTFQDFYDLIIKKVNEKQ
ncbi:MAG: phosphopantetheine-binding protein [Mucinivorans sp.]